MVGTHCPTWRVCKPLRSPTVSVRTAGERRSPTAAALVSGQVTGLGALSVFTVTPSLPPFASERTEAGMFSDVPRAVVNGGTRDQARPVSELSSAGTSSRDGSGGRGRSGDHGCEVG